MSAWSHRRQRRRWLRRRHANGHIVVAGVNTQLYCLYTHSQFGRTVVPDAPFVPGAVLPKFDGIGDNTFPVWCAWLSPWKCTRTLLKHTITHHTTIKSIWVDWMVCCRSFSCCVYRGGTVGGTHTCVRATERVDTGSGHSVCDWYGLQPPRRELYSLLPLAHVWHTRLTHNCDVRTLEHNRAVNDAGPCKIGALTSHIQALKLCTAILYTGYLPASAAKNGRSQIESC